MRPKKIVLVVDDQQVDRLILQNMLCQEYQVLLAENGQRGMDILRERGREISAVVLDIVMPVMDGYGVLEEMHKDPRLINIPVIITTHQDGEETELKTLEMGAADFVTKPYNRDIICQRLKNLIQMREAIHRVDLVERDSLTGVYNKDGFYQRATEKLVESPNTPFDIVSVDIERFKLVNDTYGTEEGDHLLRFLGEHIAGYIQPEGGLCARIGADQFIALYPRQEGYAERMVEVTRKLMEGYPLGMKVVLKYGIYQVDDRSIPIAAMCDRAVLAGKQNKGQYGRDIAYYDDAIRERLLTEQRIADEMKEALGRGQFQVYLQPKYDLVTECITGAEALVRWDHPGMGFLPPAEFVPLFEHNGFITEMDMFMWEESCAILERWLKTTGKYVPISVNVSRRDIYTHDLPSVLLEMIQRHGLEPKHLHLEITETAYTEDQEQLVEVVSQLKNLGFVIEMDDFGSGYSSLNMLSELPLNIIKLDMKFMQKKQQEKSNENILGFIISLAKWMNLRVVAEGVETEEQVRLLRNMDCDYAQGFYYAKPMSQADFEALIANSTLANPEEESPIDLLCSRRFQKDGDELPVMLIVDDVPMNRMILGSYFSEQFSIAEADDGGDACAYLEAHGDRVEIILLDLIMPEMDGFQFLEHVKSDARWKDIPVVVTSQTGEASEARALKLGAEDFISKPYHREVAMYRVRNALMRNQAEK